MKTCVKCKVEKSKDNFHKDNLRKDGLFPYCRECRGTKKRASYKEYKRTHTSGYILLNIPDHPLAQSNGYVYEHRYVFHNHFKDSELKCEFCGKAWEWRTYKDHIDHIDEDKANNSIINLRPLCNSCNVNRTKKTYCEFKGGLPITHNGITDTPEAWSRAEGVKVTAACIRHRKSKGMSDHDALFMPKKTHNSK